MNISVEHIHVFILQTQRSHLPLRLLGGRAVPGSHPAHLQVRLHRVLRVQLQHRADCALRQAAGRPPLPLTAAYQTAAGLTDRLYKPLISLILQTVFFFILLHFNRHSGIKLLGKVPCNVHCLFCWSFYSQCGLQTLYNTFFK